ncbi:MAG: M23 family metallopeptidase [Defluviitaleaceae bacterium]|nr:M23 family metallopeptidase [Defluviitaleaceae bacterium]
MWRRIANVFAVLFVCFGMKVFAGQACDGGADGAEYIKWMSFDVPLDVLKQAYRYDVESQDTDYPLDFVQLIAYVAAKNWGNFEGRGESESMDEAVERVRNGELMYEITKEIKLYEHYLVAYSAVLGGFVGEYELLEMGERKYGLKVFSPMAKGFGFTHSNDFGNPRSYGYSRPHLGHDLFGATGAPIIAVEGGVVEALGWNQYGGWRIGIRSHCGKRYYYYAHLMKDTPYAEGLALGGEVAAGDVIGYLGSTGYSRRENVSNIKSPHLHFGLQIIFDESQKDGKNQIWIDTYSIVRFLGVNRMEVEGASGGEYRRVLGVDCAPME